MTRIVRWIASAILALGLAGPALADARLDESSRLVEDLVEHIATVFDGDPDPATIRAESDAVLDEYFDYDSIARFSAGNAWRGASDGEKADYKEAFRELMLALAETHFDLLRTLEYESDGATAKGEKLVIVSGIVRDLEGTLPDTAVNWRVRTWPDKPPRIIDIEIENISMLITQQQEHTAIINKNGGSFRALIDSLDERAAAIRAQGAAGD